MDFVETYVELEIESQGMMTRLAIERLAWTAKGLRKHGWRRAAQACENTAACLANRSKQQ